MKIKKNIVIPFLIIISGLWIVACSNKVEQPNILFILSDDHPVNAIGCYNKRLSDEVRTPNTDQLAAEEMLFTQIFCTNSICSPSRATIITGKYSHKNEIYCLNQYFDSTQVTSAPVLHGEGYQTAVYVKWHLVSRPAGFFG